ncbi:MAG: Rne/Rng family ribonuclease [Desulfovibrio sp.]|jgi:ribonuclease E|nr:Rne/Rng family ribonuclease [Desulfovibrio sp.]
MTDQKDSVSSPSDGAPAAEYPYIADFSRMPGEEPTPPPSSSASPRRGNAVAASSKKRDPLSSPREGSKRASPKIKAQPEEEPGGAMRAKSSPHEEPPIRVVSAEQAELLLSGGDMPEQIPGVAGNASPKAKRNTQKSRLLQDNPVAIQDPAEAGEPLPRDAVSATSGRAGTRKGTARTGGSTRQKVLARTEEQAAAKDSAVSGPPPAAAGEKIPAIAEAGIPVPSFDDPSAAKRPSGRTRSSRNRGKREQQTTPVPAALADPPPLLNDAGAATAKYPDAGISISPVTPYVTLVSASEELPDVTSPPSDFPSSFGDASPEDFFRTQPAVVDYEQAEKDKGDTSQTGGAADEHAGEKKRRNRSRRGRGRRKASVSATDAPDSPEEGDASRSFDELPVSPAIHEEEFPQWSVEDEEQGGDGDAGDREAPAMRAKDGSPDGEDAQEVSHSKMPRRKMFVSILPEEQVEVVITEEGHVQEYYVEMLHQAKTKGNIYKSVVHNVDPNLQAAFVSYGAAKNGFLQIDEIHPEYYVSAHDDNKGRKYPPIQKVIKPGQEVLVQVVKEPAGTKGAFLTTYLSMPGRFLVLTPGREQIGVSRKVENEHERARLRELLEGLNPGSGLGVIVRTVSMGASKTSLQRDLQYLKRTWKDVRARGTAEKAPSLIYQEEDLIARAVRDYLTEAVGEVWVDDDAAAGSIAEVAETLFPRKQNLVRVHKEASSSLFERFNLQRQLDQIHSREVSLPSGGRLVIDPTEALTAIDINSGRSGGKSNFEDMAYRTNIEAARMIPLQLRLRDIGGQIVVDFIEMRDKNHWREVEKTLRNGMKIDRARYDVGKIGPFGMMEIVRQRLGSSAISVSTESCPCCNGTGVRRNMEWRSQRALRDIHRTLRNAQTQNQSEIMYQADQALALHLLNNKRQRLLEMEQSSGIRIDIHMSLADDLHK